MNQIPIKNYAVVVQKIHHPRSGEYCLLGIDATSLEDAREAAIQWCQ